MLDSDSLFSEITRLEVLGFHRLSFEDLLFFESVFEGQPIFPIDSKVIQQAILFRQIRKLSVGDAIVAATARLNGLEIYTRNEADFSGLPGLKVVNPIR